MKPVGRGSAASGLASLVASALLGSSAAWAAEPMPSEPPRAPEWPARPAPPPLPSMAHPLDPNAQGTAWLRAGFTGAMPVTALSSAFGAGLGFEASLGWRASRQFIFYVDYTRVELAKADAITSPLELTLDGLGAGIRFTEALDADRRFFYAFGFVVGAAWGHYAAIGAETLVGAEFGGSASLEVRLSKGVGIDLALSYVTLALPLPQVLVSVRDPQFDRTEEPLGEHPGMFSEPDGVTGLTLSLTIDL